MPENNSGELDIKAQIKSLEYLVKHMIWNISVIKANEKSETKTEIIADLQKWRGNVREELDLMVIPSVDAVTSDHLSALASEHVDRLLVELIREFEADA